MSLQKIFESEFSKPTVFKDRNKIMPHYTPYTLPFREEQQNIISRVIAPALNGIRPDNLFVYGRPGSGKTSSTKHATNELVLFVATNNAKLIDGRLTSLKEKLLLLEGADLDLERLKKEIVDQEGKLQVLKGKIGQRDTAGLWTLVTSLDKATLNLATLLSGLGSTPVANVFIFPKLQYIQQIYVNCRTHNRQHQVMIKCLKELYPARSDKEFLGHSKGYLYEQLVGFVRDTETHLILILDELDKIRDLDDLIYNATRSNSDLPLGSISIIGISNNLSFKDALDPRTKSSLCQQEMIFPPYDAEQLIKILTERVDEAFFPNMVEHSAIARSAQLAAQESGDARTALKLMLKAGELADREGASLVKDDHVNRGKSDVEKDMMIEHISSRPEQEKILLYTIASMELKGSTARNLYGETTGRLMSGDIYEEYQKIHAKVKLKDEDKPVTDRQVREYLNSFEMDGLISIVPSGVGVKGQTRFIKLKIDPSLVKEVLEKEFFG